MKVKVVKDRRGEADRKIDDLYNKMVRTARLTPLQENTVADYIRKILIIRMHEIESVTDMSWMISLIEGEGFGTDPNKGATRLLRAQRSASEIREEAYGHKCVDANGIYRDYDGCGLEHLQVRLKQYGCEYNARLGEGE